MKKPTIPKHYTVKTLCVILFSLFLAASCEKPFYPIKISFSEYSLEKTQCQWTNIEYNDKVLIINSKEELEKYIECNDSIYTDIDFSKNTLLLASGTTNKYIEKITLKDFQHISSNNFKLDVEIILAPTATKGIWSKGLIVEKMSKESIIELKITLEELKIEYPIDIPFEEYFLEGTKCEWVDFERNKIFIINDNEELKNFVACNEGDFPVVDFEKHTLLLARGWATNGIHYIDINFLKETASEYTLIVSIHTNATAFPQPWLISIVTPKIDNATTISLKVQHIND